MPKLIIIEGPDRSGKDTLIKNLQKRHPNSRKIHWGYPSGQTNDEKTEWQKNSFKTQFENWNLSKELNILDYVIWNRSHIGEYVYGTIYRNSEPNTWIPALEDEYLKNDLKVYLVFLTADPAFTLSQDDGNSYSININDKKLELETFNKAFASSKIQNKRIFSVHDENGYYPAEGILHQVLKFINDKH
jgi:thymidylate kinase